MVLSDNRMLYRVIKKSLCICFLHCNHQVHRDVLITLYFAMCSYLQNLRMVTFVKHDGRVT